ncbi:MAG: hypothetical protein JXA91_07890 [Candidatus Thermoplasmatota archaeon]|nr:hypothetical protein [Candidatus Thermoplasmatota archaeon]
MEKNKSAKDFPRYICAIIPLLPSIIFRTGWAFLGYKREAKKGGVIFYKELINQKIDKKTATDLTDIYLNGSKIFQNILKFRY